MKVQRHAVKAKGYGQYLAGVGQAQVSPQAFTLLALTLLA